MTCDQILSLRQLMPVNVFAVLGKYLNNDILFKQSDFLLTLRGRGNHSPVPAVLHASGNP